MSGSDKNARWITIFGQVILGIGVLKLLFLVWIYMIAPTASSASYIFEYVGSSAIGGMLFISFGALIWKRSTKKLKLLLWILFAYILISLNLIAIVIGIDAFAGYLLASWFHLPIALMLTIMALGKLSSLPSESDGTYALQSRKKTATKLYFFSLLAVVYIGVVLVNVISSNMSRRYDMTEDQRYSLANGTIEFLNDAENFKSRLNIKIYLEGNLPAELSYFRDAVEEKLKEFKQHTGDRIEYQFIDPHVGTEQEQEELFQTLFAKGKGILPMDLVYMKDGSQSQMMLWPGAIIEYGGSTVNSIQLLPGSKTGQPFQLNGMSDIIQNSINNLEYMLVSSLRRATQETKPRIAFLQGHGELTYAQTQRCRALISPYYSIADITINDSLAALDNVDGLIIAQPRKTFTQKELFIIDQFVMRGGRLMCFIDKLFLPEDTLNTQGQTHTTRYAQGKLGIDGMLFDYGLKVNDKYVMDVRCVPKQVPFANQSMIPWFFHVLATPTDHPISRNVEPVALKYTGEVEFVTTNPSVALTPILTSSTNSTVTGSAPLVNLAFPLNYGKNPELVPNPDSEANKMCLAGLAEGKFVSHFRNRIVDEYALNKAVTILDSSEVEGKVFVIGNGRFIANQYDSMPNRTGTAFMYRPKQINDLQVSEELMKLNIPHFFGNQEFFQNLTDYMMGDNSVLDIRSRQIDIHEIDNEQVKEFASFYKLLNIGLPIGIILLLALIINYIRKRKFAQ
jgi:gliding-associated putative ABC transporter substrate-binding component GldG